MIYSISWYPHKHEVIKYNKICRLYEEIASVQKFCYKKAKNDDERCKSYDSSFHLMNSCQYLIYTY